MAPFKRKNIEFKLRSQRSAPGHFNNLNNSNLAQAKSEDFYAQLIMDKPNSSYGGQSRLSALRNSRSPPRNEYPTNPSRSGSMGKPQSPLRSRVAQTSSQKNQEEEIMYERSRQEELRRQIEEKERELENMSQKNRARLNRQGLGDHLVRSTESQQQLTQPPRPGSSSGYSQTTSNQYKRNSNSPLRDRNQSSGKKVGFNSNYGARSSSRNGVTGSFEPNKGPASRLIPMAQKPPVYQQESFIRQKSPKSPSALRYKVGSRSPTRDIDMRDAGNGLLTGGTKNVEAATAISPVRSASNEYINQLRQDNTSLQKRLNLVLLELDRVNRDRSNLVQKYSNVDQDVKMMKRQLNTEDNADVMNQQLQMDVNSNRENNVNIKRSIADSDMTRTDAIQKLRQLQAERDRRVHMNDELKDDLAKKLSLCKQLEQEQYHAHEKIKILEEQISSLNRSGLLEKGQIQDIRRVVQKLTDERDDLQMKLEHLNHTYDNCVVEITRERAQMEGHNRHHNKLLVAKVTFILLEQMFVKRKQEAMNEFFQYCKFDSKCHNTLKQFVKTIERLGKFRQRIAMKQWHQRTFKPIEMKLQKEDLCYVFMRKKLIGKMFNMWRNRQQQADGVYGAKNKALQAIWNCKARDCGKEVQRAFKIWRDNLKYVQFVQQRVKKLVWSSYSNKLAKAWHRWVNFSKTMDGQVRLHVLSRTLAETQLKRVVINEMRYVLFDMKRKRFNRLRTYLKAWKEANQYKKFMEKASLTVLRFKKDCNRTLIKTCFDALRQSKEEEKFLLMSEALEGDCMPGIEELNKDIEMKTQVAVRSGRNRSLDSIKNRIYRQVAEYFNKWKGVQKRQSVLINTNLKGMIIRRWQMSIRDAFNLWKLGVLHKDITMQQGIVMEMQEEGANLAQAVESLNKEIEIQKKQVDRSGRSALNRGTKIMQKRYLKQYLDKWAEKNRIHNNQKEGSATILTKMRKRFLRQAFDLYKAGCAREKLAERNESSCEQLKKALDNRLMKKVFTAVKGYNTKNMTAKRYLGILLGKMESWDKKRAFGLWMEGGNQMKIEMCIETQNQLTEEMTKKNNVEGLLAKKVADKSQRNAELQANLEKMGSRSMTNHFQRAYYKRISYAFEKWREYKRTDKHKERIIRNTIQHMLKAGANYLMTIMKKWKNLAKINDQKNTKLAIELEMNDTSLVQNGQTIEYQKQKAGLEEMKRTVKAEHEIALIKRSKVVALMTEKNQNNVFCGRLRALFMAWSAHTKRQHHFANCIQKVISKSMWQRGYQNIREFARDKKLTRSQNTSLDKIRKMFFRRNCGAAFSKWRQTEYEQALEMIAMTGDSTEQLVQEHMDKKRVIQKQNMVRSTKIITKEQRHKFFMAWKNITRWLKHKRVSTTTLLEAQSSYAVKRLIKKWRARKDITVAARAAYEKFQIKRELLYKRAVYRELMQKHHRDKALVLKLSNSANKFDCKNLQSAFQMIKNFSQAKKDVHASNQDLSSRNLGGVLTKIYKRKLLQYYSHLRRQIHGSKVVEKKKKTMFGHFISANVRDAFMRWKKKALFSQTVIEVNEIGPVVEEVLDKQLDVANLKNLMTSEGFTPNQIEDVAFKASKKSLELISRSIGRWKHWNRTDDYLKPKMFDRWRRFIQFRKIVKHWLDFITNRQQHQKADLSYCFNKWKFFFNDKQNNLQKKTRAQLMNRGVLAAKRLDTLADSTQQDEDMINHLSDQNEELFANYRKSQKLALSLGRDNHRNAMMRALSRMMDSAAISKRSDIERALSSNVGLIAAMKDKICELEHDNESLANENEELRQFSLDGYQLGKNVQSLTSEREKLSVDLADKANTIKKLLDENERLSVRLRQAQENAAYLLRKTQDHHLGQRYMQQSQRR